MDAKNFVTLCHDIFFCGAGAASTLKNLSGEDAFKYFEVILALFNGSHNNVIDESELLKALKELEPELREHIQKATEENIKEFNEKLN